MRWSTVREALETERFGRFRFGGRFAAFSRCVLHHTDWSGAALRSFAGGCTAIVRRGVRTLPRMCERARVSVCVCRCGRVRACVHQEAFLGRPSAFVRRRDFPRPAAAGFSGTPHVSTYFLVLRRLPLVRACFAPGPPGGSAECAARARRVSCAATALRRYFRDLLAHAECPCDFPSRSVPAPRGPRGHRARREGSARD